MCSEDVLNVVHALAGVVTAMCSVELLDIVTVMTALAGAVTGIGSLVITWRRNNAAVRRDEVETLRAIIAELRARVAEMEYQVAHWRTKYLQLMERVQQLGVQLDANGFSGKNPDS